MKNKLDPNILKSNKTEVFLIGLSISLISLIGLIGRGPIGDFLQYSLLFVFGYYYLLFLTLTLAYGIALMIKGRFIKLGFNLYSIACIFIVLVLLIGSTMTNYDITLSNFNNQYLNTLNSCEGISLFKVSSLSEIFKTGGGYVGYFLFALLNTTITKIGVFIVLGVLGTLAILILLKDPISLLIRTFKKKDNKEIIKVKEVKEDSKYEELPQIEEKEIKTFPVREEKIAYNDLKPVEEVKRVNDIQTSQIEDLEIKDDLNLINIEEEQAPVFEDLEEIETLEQIEDIEEKEKIEEIQDKPQNIETTSNIYNKDNNTTQIDILESFNKEEPKPTFEEEDTLSRYDQIFNKPPQVDIKEKVKIPYMTPPIDIFKDHSDPTIIVENRKVAEERRIKINEILEEYNIGATCVDFTIGPSVTRFNIKFNPGVKVNSLTGIEREIAIKLGGLKTVRIELVVEGRDTSSIEVGNVRSEMVNFKECLYAIRRNETPKDKITFPLGKGIDGEIITTDFEELVHTLVAGTTGSGKSVFIKSIIATLLMRNTPEELKLVLIDPKVIEFARFQQIPHLLCPVVTDVKKAKNALKKLVDEMNRRYNLFNEKGRGCSKISQYNAQSEKYGYEKLPNIILIIDEFTDMMVEYGKEVEPYVKRLASKARAAGIYLIICTQRPSANVITGDIKGVIPSKIGLKVGTAIDSRIILDENGAETLKGNGDMLASVTGRDHLQRIQGAYIPDEEIDELVDFIKSQGIEPEYDENFNLDEEELASEFAGTGTLPKRLKDELHEQVKEYILRTGKCSTSAIQSMFGIGFGRADNILMCLEEEGILRTTKNNRREIVYNPNDE